MKVLGLFFALVLAPAAFTVSGQTKTEEIRAKLASADREYVFVAMHRGDWRNFPENSKGAILSSIRLGADIVELDVQKTKDGRFVLNHDDSLERTTTGEGNVGDFTLAEIKQLKMRDRDCRIVSPHLGRAFAPRMHRVSG
jgi:glycerophosphoryl diester phosphodiesterase